MKAPSANIPIIDLHCDLLSCIQEGQGKYGFDSPELNCSVPQLLEGGVKLQVMAVAAITSPGSATNGKQQIDLYQQLRSQKHQEIGPFTNFSITSPKTHCMLAIENASAIVEEHEPLGLFWERMATYQSTEKILYISLTWNQENRFGGGNLTKIGLKDDGRAVLEYLSGKKIAIDLSHTSDALAYDILNCIHKKSLDIPIIASHSNYRRICEIHRNLPEEIAKEIFRHRGLVGINFVHRFVGKTPESFLDHIAYAISIGGENAICLGADFYGGLNIPDELCPGRTKITFFPDYSNAGRYPLWIELLQSRFSEKLIRKICHENAESFFTEKITANISK